MLFPNPQSRPNPPFLSLARALALCCLWSAGNPLAASGREPNVVILFVDDLGYGDIGPFGATRQRTPQLDRMAREGLKLTSFYAAPVCSVSRAQLLTGCYGARVSVPGVYAPGSKNGLNPNEITIAEHLKKLGYASLCVGKWHLGDQPGFLPTRQGFDHYFGIPYSNDMQRTAKATGQKVVPLVRDEAVVELLTDEAQSRIVERYTGEALEFIRASKDRPFFLYFPHTAVHTPIHPGAAFAGKSGHGRFADWVEEVDWSVGQVLDTLRELKLDRNTLVLFTSDNGPWLIKGADGGSAGPLRGGKGSTWEGGVRVPALAWWPGTIAPGSVCDAVAGTIDLLPAIVSLAGGTVPAEPVLDGRDISPLLLGRTKASPREAHYYFAGYHLQAVRQGAWKLAIATQQETKAREPAEDAGKNPRLYNLDQEIGEQTNLAAEHPDVVARLEALAAQIQAEIGGTAPAARRPAGEVENPQPLFPSQPRLEGGRNRKPARLSPQEAAQPADLSQLRAGDAVPAAAAPRIAGKPFTLTCTVEVAQPRGILLAHGGAAAGYALHFEEGELVFTVRDKGAETRVRAAFPVSGGPQSITASLDRAGTQSLQVGAQTPVTARRTGLISRQPQEDFCLGHDNRKPVTQYADTTPFDGRIAALSIRSIPETNHEND